MGQETSQEEVKQVEILEVKKNEKKNTQIVSEYEGIPIIDPLIQRTLLTEKYPDDISLPVGKLPEAQEYVKNYFNSISYHLNKNQDILARSMKKQLDDYSNLNNLLEQRRTQLEERLDNILTLFKSLDEDVKNSTEHLNNVIDRADKLAKMLDPTLPTFEEYKSQ